jgi:hypothetical protein
MAKLRNVAKGGSITLAWFISKVFKKKMPPKPENIFFCVILIGHAVFHVTGEMETADISIILVFYSREHTKVVLRDPTSSLTFLCSLV